jgi:hypothetical protein
MARSDEAAEDDAQNVKQSQLAGMKHIRELNMKLMDMARQTPKSSSILFVRLRLRTSSQTLQTCGPSTPESNLR